MESVGARLKKIRLEKGLSLEEVQKKTRIHLSILRAIEEESLLDLNPVYIRGFVKIYCVFLGVNPEGFIAGYKDSAQPGLVARGYDPSVEDDQSHILKRRPLLPSLKLPVIRLSPGVLRALAGVALAVIVLFVAVRIGKAISGAARSWSARKSRPAARVQQQPAKPARASSPAKKQKAVPSPGAAVPERAAAPAAVSAAAETVSGIRLSVLAKEDCWVNLKSDGKVVFHAVLKRGRTETWQAKEKMELSVGNAGVVNLEVNGKLITNLGRKGQALKNILITREGLSIAQ